MEIREARKKRVGEILVRKKREFSESDCKPMLP